MNPTSMAAEFEKGQQTFAERDQIPMKNTKPPGLTAINPSGKSTNYYTMKDTSDTTPEQAAAASRTKALHEIARETSRLGFYCRRVERGIGALFVRGGDHRQMMTDAAEVGEIYRRLWQQLKDYLGE
jgi:hypothetical protein